MIVLKFGGTSVGSAEAIRRSAEIVAERALRRPVVVLSAMRGVTDQLLESAGLAMAGDRRALEEHLQKLRVRHVDALEALAPEGPARKEGYNRLVQLLSSLEGALDAVQEPGGAEWDAVAAHGELLSTTLFAAALPSVGLNPAWVDVREVMITDDDWGRALPDPDELARRARRVISPLVGEGRIPVTQGFVGSTPEGTTTTIGRGGSDFSATLLGRALEVEEIQIWTDVHGLMSADPRVVPQATALDQVTYDEAAELAYFGAKVLHPAAIVPALEAGIDVRIRNSLEPRHPGTRISADPGGRPGRVKSIASKRGIATLSVRSPRMLGAHGYLRRLFAILDRHRIVVDVVATSEVSVSLSLESGSVPPQVMAEVLEMGGAQLEENRAIICVVGEALRETPGVAARLFRAIAPVNVEMISQGASRINITLVVKDADAPEVVRRLHDEFFPE